LAVVEVVSGQTAGVLAQEVMEGLEVVQDITTHLPEQPQQDKEITEALAH
jgi:hypothetical protein